MRAGKERLQAARASGGLAPRGPLVVPPAGPARTSISPGALDRKRFANRLGRVARAGRLRDGLYWQLEDARSLPVRRKLLERHLASHRSTFEGP